jgi:hypothetical protein
MLINASPSTSRSLVALWDKGRADGPGAAEDLVAQVEARGHKVDRLLAERLKQLAAT